MPPLFYSLLPFNLRLQCRFWVLMVPVNLIYPQYVVAARQMVSFWKWQLSLWDDDVACLIHDAADVLLTLHRQFHFYISNGTAGSFESLCWPCVSWKKKTKNKINKASQKFITALWLLCDCSFAQTAVICGLLNSSSRSLPNKKANSQNYRAPSSWSWWECHRYPNKHKLNLLLKLT